MRFKAGVEGPDGVEVLLISSNSGKRPVFPKGGWEQDEELQEAALRETLEEAGVRGTLEEPLVGKFPFLSAKAPAQRTQMTHGGRCMAYLFVMHVSEVLEVWPEAKQRKREWVSYICPWGLGWSLVEAHLDALRPTYFPPHMPHRKV